MPISQGSGDPDFAMATQNHQIKGKTLDQRASGLQRIEDQIAVVLARLDDLPYSAQLSSNDNKKVAQAILAGGKANLYGINDPDVLKPGFIAEVDVDLRDDARQWRRGNSNSTENASAASAIPSKVITVNKDSQQTYSVDAKSGNASTEVSSGHIRNERKETAMRLEGSHPDLLIRTHPYRQKGLVPLLMDSKWSRDSRSLVELDLAVHPSKVRAEIYLKM